MTHGRNILALALALTLGAAAPAFGQGAITSTISGSVVDRDGGIIPGATVVATNEAGAKYQAVTNSEGVFAIPALDAGSYKVTVALSGFKTWASDVRLAPNTPVTLKVLLEVGAITETVTVTSGAELVNTQTATVSSTLNADQLNRMPTPTRNALNAVTFLPGVNTSGIIRDSTVNGLPQSMISITLDGVSNNDNFNKSSDGFFASVTPRQDAVEAVTVTTAVSGSNSGGSGGVSIGFQTRSGTNRYTGSAYEYWRDPSLNSNYWFNELNNLPKNQVKVNQYGARYGGPIVLPGVYDGRGKAFFFGHYEQLRFPNSFTRTRTVYHPDALQGWYSYDVNGVTRRVNVLDLARASGQIAALDPTIMGILTKIQDATKTTGVVKPTSDPMLDSYVWQAPAKLFEHQPTVRVDYNLSVKHRLSGSAQEIFAKRTPDYLNSREPRFPGAPQYRQYSSSRPLYSMTLRSVLSPNMVNELRGGLTALGGAGSSFGRPEEVHNGVQAFADQGGFAIDLPLVTDWHTSNATSWRAAPTYNLDEIFNWQQGRHALIFGGSFLRSSAWENASQPVPSISLGVNTANDPGNVFFTSANFPGGSLGDARSLYAMLTGRVTTIGGQAALDPATNTYKAFAPRRREGYLDVYSLFAQDAWRVRPTVTINAGVRWDLQTPFKTKNDTMSMVTLKSACGMSGLGDGSTYNKCNFFSPGTNTGVVPEFVQYRSGTKGYDTDWNNVSPSISVAWRPNVTGGWLRPILGDPEVATLRGGYSETYERQGLGFFTGLYGGNPGSTISLTRNATIGNLVLPGEPWPVLFSQRERLAPAAFSETPIFPIAVRTGRADDLNLFAPDTKIASARSWTISFQRSISKDMAVDIRYVGTRGVNQWSELDYNARDILSNKFYDEFLLAVQNLKTNVAAGRGASFAYMGPGTGTTPLPIYLAYLAGRTDAANPAAYTTVTSWTSTALTNDMVFVRPNPFDSAADLDGDATRRGNAAAAGLPANFFVLNPAIDEVLVTDSGAFSDYHALQIDLRRRLSKGLSADLNYQYAIEGGSSFLGFRYGRVMNPTANVRHAIKTQWDWAVPVGRGQRFGADMNPWLSGVLGGWSFIGVGRVQAQMANFGNVRLVGMNAKDVQKMFKHDVRIDPATGLRTVYMMPDDVIQNTRRAYSQDPASPTGYGALGVPQGRYFAPANNESCIQLKTGDCAPRTLLIRAPWFSRFDVGISKRFPLPGRANVETRFDILNVFDNVNFNLSNSPGAGATIFQVNSAYQDTSNTFDPGGRLGQLMIRVNW